MLVRGAGEGFNLIVPVRRMRDYCEEHKIMWAMDPTKKMPTEAELKKMPIENEPKESSTKKSDIEEAADAEDAEEGKEFPFMIRIYPKKIVKPSLQIETMPKK